MSCQDNKDPSYAYRKWPVMNPGMIGFDDWFSTEASASRCGFFLASAD